VGGKALLDKPAVAHMRGTDIAKPQAVFITISTLASEPGVQVGGIDYPNDYIIIIPQVAFLILSKFFLNL
jgi:hypothetical protein